MSETLQPPRITFPDDAALDAAAETLTGLTLLNAADLAWASLTALAEGERSDTVVHHRAIVLLALQVKPLRDWLLVQAIDHEDLSLACTRELVWLVAKAPQPLQAAAAGATAMLLIAITGSAPAARYHADLGGSDTLAQLVGHIVESQLPGIERSRTLQRKREADAFRVDLDSAIQKATYVDPRGGRVRLSEYAAAWLDSRHTSEARGRIADNAIRLHITPLIGDFRLNAIETEHVQEWVDQLALTLSPGSVRNVYEVLAQILASAVNKRLISRSPIVRRGEGDPVRLPAMDREERWLIPEEVEKLIISAPDDIKMLTRFLASTGLRIGEALGL